ncbi:hypothetical protein ACIP51_34105, partial [Streptomyces sp. NPDC088755]
MASVALTVPDWPDVVAGWTVRKRRRTIWPFAPTAALRSGRTGIAPACDSQSVEGSVVKVPAAGFDAFVAFIAGIR